jgi:hypothetical protein
MAPTNIFKMLMKALGAFIKCSALSYNFITDGANSTRTNALAKAFDVKEAIFL